MQDIGGSVRAEAMRWVWLGPDSSKHCCLSKVTVLATLAAEEQQRGI